MQIQSLNTSIAREQCYTKFAQLTHGDARFPHLTCLISCKELAAFTEVGEPLATNIATERLWRSWIPSCLELLACTHTLFTMISSSMTWWLNAYPCLSFINTYHKYYININTESISFELKPTNSPGVFCKFAQQLSHGNLIVPAGIHLLNPDSKRHAQS